MGFVATCTFQQQMSSTQFHGNKPSQFKYKIHVPNDVKIQAQLAFKLRDTGFKGATKTGWDRAYQLSTSKTIPIEDLRYMKNWYARHIYTSYPSYKMWIDAGKPQKYEQSKKFHNKRGIIAWLTWGGDKGYEWVTSSEVTNILSMAYPKK